MWKWISNAIDKRSLDHPEEYIRDSVNILKEKWCKKNGFGNDSRCFFCEYGAIANTEDTCLSCPGRLVDRNFYCVNSAYAFDIKPKKFYQKLLKLNAKRIAKRKAKK
jgi:hypothetical protein